MRAMNGIRFLQSLARSPSACRYDGLAWLAGGLLLVLACTSAAAVETSPLDVVKEASSRMTAALKAEGKAHADPEFLYRLVEEIVLPHVDFERMSRLVLGKYWHRATPEQRRRFVQAFRDLLVRTYATALADYADVEIEYLPMRTGTDPSQVTVRTEIHRPGGLSIPVYYSFYHKNGEWKAFDVSIDGVSLVTNYRSSFAAEIRQNGIEGLLKRLERRKRNRGGDSGNLKLSDGSSIHRQ